VAFVCYSLIFICKTSLFSTTIFDANAKKDEEVVIS